MVWGHRPAKRQPAGISAKPGTSIGRIIVTGAIALFVSGALSYVGAAYLSGSLADTEYLLEVNIFRGIKLTFVLPIILVAIAFLTFVVSRLWAFRSTPAAS